MQQVCIKKPVLKGNRVKEYGIIINFPTEQCSESERDYMRTRYICKLLEWKRAEIEENIEGKRNNEKITL